MKPMQYREFKASITELEKSRDFFHFFAEKVNAVFWARDTTCNKQLYLSPAFEKIWGRSRDFLYNNPNSWIDTLHPDDRPASSNVQRFKTLDEVGQNAKFEFRYRIYTPAGELRYIKDTSFPITDDNGNFMGFAGVAEDVTNEVLHEQELREAKKRAEVANQAKSDFLAMISHELRTPLNAILGMTQILKHKELTSEAESCVDIISSAGNGLLSLVSDILDFARIEAGKLSFLNDPFDLFETFEQTIHAMQYLAKEKNLELNLNIDPKLNQNVVGDSNRIRQVVFNLVSNAIKFTDNGKVSIEVTQELGEVEHESFRVKVKDTGIGIHSDKLKSIFERFSQIDSIYQRKHGGIGLGLAISKQLVEHMGGNMSVQSVQGEGSVFEFQLNLKLQTPEQRALRCDTKAILSNHTKYAMKVLLVEDNIINQKIAQMMLEEFGCEVDIIDNGDQVISNLHNLQNYNLIFMDVGLPDVSGFEIVSRIRKEVSLQKTPIVAMTAHVLDNDKKRAFDVGMDRVLAKPISYQDLAATLEMYS